MYYGIYQGVRDSAWQCLVDFNISSVPVDVLRIARCAGIHVIRNSAVNELLPAECGKAYFDGIGWIIIYDDAQPVSVSRFTLAHELGHIFLGHGLKCGQRPNMSEFTAGMKSEMQADMFAERLLCPSCVLWKMGISAADEIAGYCRVPYEVARRRAERMKELYRRDRFLTSPLERKVFSNFLSGSLKNQRDN